MTDVKFLEYTIYLTDKDAVAEHQAFGDGYVFKAPTVAAVDYNAPIVEPDGSHAAPCIASPWFEGTENFPRDVREFERCTGGWFGICFLFGHRTHFNWVGKFVYAPGTDAPITGEAKVAMAQRRWIDGFELPDFGEGGSGNAAFQSARVASRHVQGLGLHLDNVTLSRVHTAQDFGGTATDELWERFYVRFRKFPTGKTRIWAQTSAGNAFAGIELAVLPTGQIAVSLVDNANGITLLATIDAIPVDVWKKIDLLYKSNATTGYFRLYVNGVQLYAQATHPGSGNHTNSTLAASTANGLVVNFDDWIGADKPTPADAVLKPFVFPGLDWNNGSRVAFVAATGFGSDNSGSWVGDWRISRQRPIGNTSPIYMTAAAGARLTLDTDANLEVDAQPNALGVAAFTVAVSVKRAVGPGDGSLGYRLPAGGAAVMATITPLTTQAWRSTMYRPSGVINPLTPFGGLELVYDAAAGGTNSIQALVCVAEIIGVFGEEDVVRQAGQPVVETIPEHAGIHNAPYPRSPWARKSLPPMAPVVIHAGTYVGNGTVQDLTFRCPVHLFMWRALTGGSLGLNIWGSSMLGAHLGQQDSINPEAPVEVLIDPTFVGGATEDAQEERTLVRITGNNAESNANTAVYAYLAFEDPAARFLQCGALQLYKGTADFVNHLDNEGFTPEAAFLIQEVIGSGSTRRGFYKGPGHATDAVSPLQTTEIGTGLAFGLGTMTSKSGIYLSTCSQIAYAAFRRADGQSDPGQPRVLQLASYTGDGSASRTVNFAPASGRRPLWALVVPHNNSVAVMRDASHTGTTSLQLNPATQLASTGITGGAIDALSVGSALNTNNIGYDVFCIPGDSVAGNGGFSIPGEFVPVDAELPISPDDAPWADMPEVPDETEPEPNPEPGGDAEDFGDQCVSWSTQIINQALTHLGIGKRVDDIVTEQSEEAATARLHYVEDVSAVLRDFPWPFATRYADLVLVDGAEDDPVNGDWTYSYRVPTNMMFARRIVSTAGTMRDFDPNPIKFRIGSDETGGLIYTNEAEAELEYTVRMSCAASQGDALFRQALGWKHAHSLSPVLAKDDKKETKCLQMYQLLIVRAQRAASQEQQQAPGGDADWITGRN